MKSTEILDRSPRAATVPHRVAKKRIGLLTPYNGGNLGDGAIMHAVLTQIRRRLPAAEPVGITLSPGDTTARHGIDAIPLTGVAFMAFAAEQTGTEDGNKAAATPISDRGSPSSGLLDGVKSAVKRSPALIAVARPLHTAASNVLILARRIAADFRHTAMAYGQLGGFDIVLVSGGGQLDDYWRGPWGQPYAMFKWTLLARLRNTKIAFLSVGVGSVGSRLTKLFIYGALSLAHYRSYRDEGSKKLVAYVPATRHDAVVPDLAFGFPRKDYLRADDAGRHDLGGAAADAIRPVIGVSPIAYLSREYWPKQQPEVHERYLATMVEFTRTLVERGYRVVLFSSASPDRRVAQELQLQVARRLGGEAKDLTVRLPQNVDQFFRCVRDTDLVVASRLHGILLSHIMRKPVLAISYDRKVDAHMSDLRQTDANLDIHDFALDELLAAFAKLEKDSRATRRAIETLIDEFQTKLNRQFDEVLSL